MEMLLSSLYKECAYSANELEPRWQRQLLDEKFSTKTNVCRKVRQKVSRRQNTSTRKSQLLQLLCGYVKNSNSLHVKSESWLTTT